ncbi:MAG: glycerophosphodiester phosphodiesterase [unclassified Hahellaceae]|nr:glycerophosphodiester phosphodiesterase [Hahellaceae bacterium]|tara:strand:+ start:4640 stop:5986 length:1347 start_codon:yes stop_codon:yes gene_type:complete
MITRQHFAIGGIVAVGLLAGNYAHSAGPEASDTAAADHRYADLKEKLGSLLEKYRDNRRKGRAEAQLGPRPFYLVEDMDEGRLKQRLQQCADGPFYRTDFSIGHRGAPLQFPEHTKESYEAAVVMGAGIVECDVTFTKDRELVCRHSQCDLHTTTDILAKPELAAKCSVPFTPADPVAGTPASAKCCTSDITLEEFRTLKGKMDGANSKATTVEGYMAGTADYRTDLYSQNGTLMTHRESIELLKSLKVKFTPELKAPEVDMPYEGDYTQADYASQMIEEYKAAGIDPRKVWPQSFNLEDVLFWVDNYPAFGQQAVYLDGRYADPAFNPMDASTWSPSMTELRADGVKIIAPPTPVLVTLDAEGNIVPSEYARRARAAGLDIITWSLERSGPLANGGGFYFASIADAINNDGDVMNLIHVLAQDVKVIGIFSDWPATVTYYANCANLK